MATSSEWFARARESLVGGVNSPVRCWRGVGGDPLFFHRGEGPYLYSVEGKRYTDYVCSWGPLVLGHAHPETVDAVCRAAAASTSFGASCPAEVELAEEVKKVFPSMDLLRFVSSGTEAVMTAIRAARGFTGRELILKFEGCYHGHSDGMLVNAGSGALTLGQPDSGGVPVPVASTTVAVPFNDTQKVQQAFSMFSGRIAAVIVEPWAGNMGLVPPGEGFLSFLREFTEKNSALLIFDEVITGFRVPEGGAQRRTGIVPDLTCLGKIIGGGLRWELSGKAENHGGPCSPWSRVPGGDPLGKSPRHGVRSRDIEGTPAGRYLCAPRGTGSAAFTWAGGGGGKSRHPLLGLPVRVGARFLLLRKTSDEPFGSEEYRRG